MINLSVKKNRGAEIVSWQPPRGPGDDLLPIGVSVSPLQHQHLLQIITDPHQPKMTSVPHLTTVATSLHPIVALQSADDPLHCPSHPGEEPIPALLSGGHGPIAPSPVDDAAKHSPVAQGRLAGVFGVGPIGKHPRFLPHD